MIAIEQKKLEQVLEALEESKTDNDSMEFHDRKNKAITVIKKALAQPEQEPVAWEQFYPDIGKPQLEQRPAAIYRAGQAKGEGFHVEFLKEMDDDEVLLYTTQLKRPWVGLADEEIKQTIRDYSMGALPHRVDCARAIEDKLKEKNCV